MSRRRSTTDPDEIARALEDFRRAAEFEARLCAEAEAKAERARNLAARRPRLRPGPDHSYKIAGLSNAVHYREPIR